MKYLEPTDPDAFLDFPKKEFNSALAGNDTECPKCFGHGGWNLRINSYPLHGHADTAENRHRYGHFQAHCGQCHGYGWLPASNTKCIHELEYVATVGRCLTRYGCKKCDHTEVVDSSD
jgi:hypothetical protein